MLETRSPSGRPLASGAWLDAHHRAKLPERTAFCRRLSALRPRRVVDLGCGTGLWLSELDKHLPSTCEFIGVDADQSALAEAERRSAGWSRPVRFHLADLGIARPAIPEADLSLLFNLSPYLPRVDALLAVLADQAQQVAVRQYDGAAVRFGPMRPEHRATIEDSLSAAVSSSDQFRHYDLDRLYAALASAPFSERDISFELFARRGPLPDECWDYIAGTIEWTSQYLSPAARELLQDWWQPRVNDPALPIYFTELDLVAVLS
ncbi:MAG: class I SAM-dependent methyltransferase [Solirubrobacterales bacterium]|nr:class I SAM-dependent methyltransferase [Solirubrobacterales bacterium]